MDIGHSALLNTPGANINPPTETEAGAASSAALSSDFETFLRMLTVQLQNQDPLNPVEASDYAVQLATFSGVEQQVKTNDLLASLGDQLQMSSLSQFAGWVGMEARFSGPMTFAGSPIQIVAETDSAASTANLVVKDSRDTIVQVLPIQPPGGELSWAGVDANGQPLPNGTYSFFVENMNAGNVISTTPADVYALVTEARTEANGAILGLPGGGSVAANSVTGIRAPGP